VPDSRIDQIKTCTQSLSSKGSFVQLASPPWQGGAGGGFNIKVVLSVKSMSRSIHNDPDLKSVRQGLRRQLTASEAVLWKAISGKKLDGRKFRRQHSVGPFIVDFYCPLENLIIEVDGSSHDNPTSSANDALRDAFMKKHGLRVLRVENKSILDDLPGVLDIVRSWFKEG